MRNLGAQAELAKLYASFVVSQVYCQSQTVFHTPMKSLSALLFSWVFVALLVACEGKKKPSTATKKAEKSVEPESNNKRVEAISKLLPSTPVIALTDYNFTKFVTERPRDYHAILMFTATGAKYQCGVCVKSLGSFEEIAAFYNRQYDFNSTSTENRIAFFKIEVDDGRNIFNELQLETVPRLFFLPPVATSAPKMKISKFEVDNKVLLEGTNRILEEINTLTGVKVEITVDAAPVLVALGIVAALVALFVSAAKGDMFGALLWYQSANIWVVVSSVCFAVGVSGSIFCVIKGAPLYGMTRKGVSIFATQGRDQYMLEGIIVAAMTLACGFAAYFLHIATRMRRFPLLRHLLVILSIAVWIVLGVHIFNTYTMKTGWYQLKDTFPPELWIFFSGALKKSSSLPKRLFRVSEIWLFEAKDLAGFQKKFQSLVVDYLIQPVK